LLTRGEAGLSVHVENHTAVLTSDATDAHSIAREQRRVDDAGRITVEERPFRAA